MLRWKRFARIWMWIRRCWSRSWRLPALNTVPSIISFGNPCR
ncbi:hypothetical protein EVA_00579 [gut metagenome]|uniref:Uncharacterized protein n=1 Tax=gut metagenome TaxID=749906 RepID=J9H8I0_9ZZZZ